MAMLVKIFQVTTLVLVAWLVIQSGQVWQQLGVQNHLLQQNVAAAAAAPVAQKADPLLGKINQQLDSLAAVQSEQNKAKQQLAAYQAKQEKIATLRKAYILVLEAETERTQKNAKAAAEKLKASKSLIWKSGSNYPAQKKVLQDLMKPLDMTAAAWAGGKLEKDSKAIYSVLQQVLSKQDQ
jgi:hypothetical protein